MMRKMALVPVESVSGVLPASHPKPYGRAVATLDGEINDLLNDQSLDPTTKAELTQQLVRRYLLFQRARPTDIPQPAPVPSIATPTTTTPTITAPTATASVVGTSDDEDDKITDVEGTIYKVIPQQRLGLAKTLVAKMKKSPTILSWTPSGEMKYKNKVIPHSNIASLVKDYIYPMKQTRPHGWENMADAFDEMESLDRTTPVLVRSRAATSGKVVRGRPKRRPQGDIRKALRSWQQY